ncbi:MAG TPA: hypothetical protein VFY14_05625 [Streptomyces sp.]|nr:hypothetical protein [Streptomyces sp.]
MDTAPIHPPTTERRARGATALGALDDRSGPGGHRPYRRPRHLLGNAVRAVSVFAGAAFDVAVLGDYAVVRDEADEDC